jgi:hypothetical protein
MASAADSAREWMDEGDHLLGRAYEFLATAALDPTHAEMASEYFSRAAHTYLGGAVEYQSGATLRDATLPDADHLTEKLSGRLRAEAIAARRTSATSATTGAAAAQAFAETLRDRLARAVPEAFTQPTGPTSERPLTHVRSR